MAKSHKESLLGTPPPDRLIRPLQPMPEEVRVALAARGLTDLYAARPAYQRNDYLMWINSAKRAETKAKRLAQMLDELERGGVYMNMKWTG
ncbi:YdeI/OmpD-associated family protein [Devosia oryzisoli]|nr:YdeI/OmpD-associated family protein [Devosia oryzisoli]